MGDIESKPPLKVEADERATDGRRRRSVGSPILDCGRSIGL